eukprot:CAMPEP_0177608108 /NCGR_PEP_ID=MMETSP0419_2-20121207/18287_1 /TAXON_ID=582737 /ORGANISM="Tetraselmis sp., Strain GSL018" /LENGTH=711 /DNA_ID=CAMNT_0019102759 /DNA_START=76 /DNA_END=2211 /DNA_ORIENTATION=-
MVLFLFADSILVSSSDAQTTQEAPEISRYDLVISRQWIKPDGFWRPALTTNYNGKLKGETIRVKTGGRVILNVTNKANQPITVHFHGIHQSGYQWMDGVPGATQCPIPPDHSYVYDFVVNQPPGTHIWHGHYMLTEGDGLHGLFVIEHDRTDSLYRDFPEDEFLVELSDWYHIEYRKLTEGLLEIPKVRSTGAGQPPHWPGNPQNLLINGKALWNCANDFNTQYGANPAWGFTYCDQVSYFEQVGKNNSRIVGEQEVFNVTSGKRYLLRVVNLGTVQYMMFMIREHNLTVVAADGQPVKPFTVSSLDINVAERYDVILEANGQPGETYDVVVATKFRYSDNGPYGYGPAQTAKLVYAAEPAEIETDVLRPYGMTPVDRTEGFNATHPLDYFNPRWVTGFDDLPEHLQGEPDETIFINGYMWFDPEDDRLKWPVNNVTHKSDPSGLPFLPLMVSGLGDKSLQGLANNMWDMKLNTTYDFVLHNYGETWIPELGQIDEHPWHFHGHSFHVLGYGPGRYPGFQAANESGLLNLKDPPYRDMVTTFPGILPDGSEGVNLIRMPEITKEKPWIYNFSGPNLTADCRINDPDPNCQLAAIPYGWSLIRLRADNPGVWNVHCHLMWHFAMNMQGFMVIEPDKVGPMPLEYARMLRDQCAAMGADKDVLAEVLQLSGPKELLVGGDDGPTSAPGADDSAAAALVAVSALMVAALGAAAA